MKAKQTQSKTAKASMPSGTKRQYSPETAPVVLVMGPTGKLRKVRRGA